MFDFRTFDAQAIPFDNACFDAVIACHMLHHVPNRCQALAEFRRVLRPGGHLYAATSGRDHMRELYTLAQRFAPLLGIERGFAKKGMFALETGRDEISYWFDECTLALYEDALVVTDAAPLVEYLLSGSAQYMMTDPMITAFTQFLEAEIEPTGALLITKNSGLFKAIRPRRREL